VQERGELRRVWRSTRQRKSDGSSGEHEPQHRLAQGAQATLNCLVVPLGRIVSQGGRSRVKRSFALAMQRVKTSKTLSESCLLPGCLMTITRSKLLYASLAFGGDDDGLGSRSGGERRAGDRGRRAVRAETEDPYASRAVVCDVEKLP